MSSSLDLTIPKLAMKLVPDVSGNGYRLMLHHPAGPVVEVAHVFNVSLPDDTEADTARRTKSYGHTIAASFLLRHAIDDAMEQLQPDGWDDETIGIEWANVWRGIFRAHCIANGDFAAAARLVDTPLPDDT
jgi:hypothetical protein